MERYLPQGVLGVAVTGLVAAFMAGMAANVSSFNAVFTYDLWQDYIRPGRPDRYYLRVGRWATVGGVIIGIGTAFIAAGFSNIANYFRIITHRGQVFEKYGCALYTVAALSALIDDDDRIYPVVHVRRRTRGRSPSCYRPSRTST